MVDEFLELLIHAVKAIGYRFTKATEGAKESFGNYKVSKHTRSPTEIVNHMYDLACKTKQLITEGNFNTPSPAMLDFLDEKDRFLICFKELETVMLTTRISMHTGKRLLQGPLLDMSTHIGQLAMLNGLNGNKVPKESYYNAEI